MLATVWGHVRYHTDDYSARCCACVAAWCLAGVSCLSAPGSGGDTVAQYLYPVTVSHSGHTNEYVHNVSSRVTWCTGGAV